MMSVEILLAASLLSLWLAAWLARCLSRAAEADWGGPWLNRLDGLNRIFCRRFHGLHGDRLALPESGPALVVSNHVSGVDPLLLIAASRRPLRFIIAAEQYHRFGLGWLFRAVGCIPVERTRRPERAFRAALRALAEGEVVALFPHGSIHLDSEPARPLKAGVARMARLANVPVYPVHIAGVRGEGLVVAAAFLPSRARLRAAPPVWCEEGAERTCLDAIAACIDARGTSENRHETQRRRVTED